MQKKFRGDDQWMLPSVSKKIDASLESSSSKKKEKKSKKSKKSSKKHKKEKKKSKKKKRSTSSESDDSSAEERLSKKKRKRKHFSDASSDSSSSSESDEEDTWIEKSSENKGKIEIETKGKSEQTSTTTHQREDWLGGLSAIRTFSKSSQDEQPKKVERKGIDSYEPGKSVRELNPYWKDGGDGLPKAFAKPNYDSDSNDEDSRRSYRPKQSESARSSNWKKKSELQQSKSSTSTAAATISSLKAGSSRSSSSSSSRSPTPERKSSEQNKSQASRDDFLTDQQMNELGAKLVKAEIMGNDELAQELKEKLDRARKFRKEHKSEVLAKSFERRTQVATQNKREKEENVVLTTTNSKGQSRPVASFRDDSDLWGGRAGRKAKKQKVETHLDGERVRYFADDDKYDIKRMVSFLFEYTPFTIYSTIV